MEQLVRLRRAKLVVNIPRNSLLDRDKTSWKILVEREKKTWRQHPTYHTFTHTIYLLSRRKTTKFVLFNLYSRHSSPDHFFLAVLFHQFIPITRLSMFDKPFERR